MLRAKKGLAGSLFVTDLFTGLLLLHATHDVAVEDGVAHQLRSNCAMQRVEGALSLQLHLHCLLARKTASNSLYHLDWHESATLPPLSLLHLKFNTCVPPQLCLVDVLKGQHYHPILIRGFCL